MPTPAATSCEIHLGDCIAGMAALPEGSVDVVVTSPPYNLGIDYGTYRDTLTTAEYLAWTRKWATAVRRVLRPDGSFFLNIGAAPADPFLPHQVILELADLFRLQNTLHWIKSITIETIDGEDQNRPHPATFATRLAEYCLRLHGSNPQQTTVLDLFFGIGHTAEAARQLGVARCFDFDIDIDEGYLTSACERLSAEMIRD